MRGRHTLPLILDFSTYLHWFSVYCFMIISFFCQFFFLTNSRKSPFWFEIFTIYYRYFFEHHKSKTTYRTLLTFLFVDVILVSQGAPVPSLRFCIAKYMPLDKAMDPTIFLVWVLFPVSFCFIYLTLGLGYYRKL